MLLALYAIVGLVIGAVVAWLVAANRHNARIAEAEKRTSLAEGKVSAMEATINELRTQSEQRSKQAAEDFKKLREELSAEREARVRAETQSAEMKERLAEEKKLLAEAKEKLTDAFKALAGDTLSNSNQAFLKLARETFDKILAEAKGDLGKRQEAISGLVKPLADTLKDFDEHVRQLEQKRQSAYAGIEEHLKNLAAAQQQLQKETGSLATALRTPQVRGRWGEMTLRRVVELSGMSEHCDFTEQVSVESDESRIQPDLVVHLPGGRQIVVDAKVALDAYLNALSAETDEERERFFANHTRQMRAHMNNLAGKAYWQQFDNTPEMVVMFVPVESAFADALHHDPDLFQDGIQKSVLLATPVNLIALLRTVALGWRQEQIARSAQVISDLGKQLHERMRVLVEHVAGIGKGLEKANAAYNSAVGSIEARVLPAARRFKELGVTGGDDIPLLEPINTTPRTLNAPDWREPPRAEQ
jgi:DNA recombination protein RmuC